MSEEPQDAYQEWIKVKRAQEAAQPQVDPLIQPQLRREDAELTVALIESNVTRYNLETREALRRVRQQLLDTLEGR